jgi:hypothetical protein
VERCLWLPIDRFAAARQKFEIIVSWLDASALEGAAHSVVEEQILRGGIERLRKLQAGHLAAQAP